MHTTNDNLSRRRRDPSRWRRLVLLAVACAGCKANAKYDLIEAELRTRDRELAATRAELQNSRHLNEAYQRQSRPPTGEECANTPYQPLKDVTLGTGTGGADNDNQPGDEALQIVLVPRDEDNSAVKVPATVTVLAFEVARNGTKTAIGRWDVSPDRLRRTWRSGLFSTGHYLLLQWDQLPTTERVRLVVRMQTLDGRTFEADKDVTVRVLPGAGVGQPGPPVGNPQPSALPPATVPVIPAPGVPTIPPPTVDELPFPKESRSDRPPVKLAPARSR